MSEESKVEVVYTNPTIEAKFKPFADYLLTSPDFRAKIDEAQYEFLKVEMERLMKGSTDER